MKVLIISVEVWQNGTNGGNVLSNIFEGSGFEFAQIYCSPGEPDNCLCKKYYQMTDGMAIKNVLKNRSMGRTFTIESTEINDAEQLTAEAPNKRMYSFFHTHRWGIFYAAKDMVWKLSRWKNDSLREFVDVFAPDIIFAPCYGNSMMLELTRFVADYTGKKVISYISDDHYTLRQFSFSPYFWINRLRLRNALRKTFPYYSLTYTMTEEQKKQCEKDLNAEMKILRKSANVPELRKKSQSDVIHIIYAGGIYLNRWKVLSRLADAIEKINRNRKIFHLDIYTGNEMKGKQWRLLNRENIVTVHPAVPFSELKDIYQRSDIALHVEAFDLKNRLATRMSFSTKIVDCLASGCAVMAIAWDKQAGYQYLKKNDAAICISNLSKIEEVLVQLKSQPMLIEEYRTKAAKCCRRNHDIQIMRNMIKEDFCRLAYIL